MSEDSKKRKNDKWSYFCIRECRPLFNEELIERALPYSYGFTVRDKSEWAKGGWDNLQQSRQSFTGYAGTTGEAPTPYPYNFRFWPAFASEEEKSEWWSKATAEFRHWWATQPAVRGVDDGLPARLDRGSFTPEIRRREKARQARIKQLGNSIVPFIAQLHGERIAYHELNPESFL